MQEQELDTHSADESFEKQKKLYSKVASFQRGPARQNPAKEVSGSPFVFMGSYIV
jgi:hypothetical protein